MAWPGELTLARGLATIAARPQRWPGLDSLPPDSLRLIVVPDARRFAAVAHGAAPSWGAGLAAPEERTILLRADAGDLPQVLRHELAHLALHRVLRSRVPLWFDEGYATWAAGGIGALEVLQLDYVVMRGGVGDLRDLDGALRGSEAVAGVAYPLAASAVAELARRHPEGTLRPLLERLERGEEFADAVRETTGLTLPQFEAAWQRAVRLRYGLLVWLFAAGFWAVVATFVLAGASLRRWLDRPRRAALDVGWIVPEPDEPEPDPPAAPGDPAPDPEAGGASELDQPPAP